MYEYQCNNLDYGEYVYVYNLRYLRNLCKYLLCFFADEDGGLGSQSLGLLSFGKLAGTEEVDPYCLCVPKAGS